MSRTSSSDGRRMRLIASSLAIAAVVVVVLTSMPRRSMAQDSDSGWRDHDRGAQSTKVLAGYYPEWKVYSGFYVQNLDVNGTAGKLTELLYAFANVNSQGQCALVDPWADYQKPIAAANAVNGVADSGAAGTLAGNFNQIVELKAKYPKLKVLISIGGFSDSGGFSQAAMTQASRQALVSSCLNMFIAGNVGPGVSSPGLFDGIDIDWEYPAACGLTCGVPQDTRDFTLLLAEFRRQLDEMGESTNKHYLLTIAAPAGEQNYSLIQLSIIPRFLDYVDLMTYDYHGPWESATNNVAPLFASPDDPSASQGFFIEHTVSDYLAAGVPARKIVLGVPLYGYGWTGVPATNNGLYQPAGGLAPGDEGAGTASWHSLAMLAQSPGFTEYRDPNTLAPWLYNATSGVFWTFDDPSSLAAKTWYVRTRTPGGLAGAFVWDLSGDDSSASMINPLYYGLHETPPSRTFLKGQIAGLP